MFQNAKRRSTILILTVLDRARPGPAVCTCRRVWPDGEVELLTRRQYYAPEPENGKRLDGGGGSII